jgi:hypothetical protein
MFLAVHNITAASTFPSVSEIGFALITALPLAVLASFLSVPFGLFPAASAGACYWYVLEKHTKYNPKPLLRAFLGGSVGLLISVIFGLLFSFSDAPGAYQPAVNLFSWASAGALGGALSALTVGDATYAMIYGRKKQA